MKICFFTPTVSIGGYERIILNIMSEIEEEFEIFTIANNAIGDNKEEFEKLSNVIDLKVTRIRYMFVRAYKVLKKINPDIVYVSFENYVFIINLIKFIFRLKFKVVVGEHLITKPKNKILKIIYRWAYKRSNRIIAVSEFTKKELINNLKLDSNNIDVVYNPIINKEFEYNYNNNNFQHKWINEKYKTIVLLGRVEKDKGFQYVLRSFSLLDNKSDKKILIVGDGTYREHLEIMVKELDLEDYVEFLGFIKQPISILRKCDYLIVFSDYETFGNTVVEALYAYCNIITYKGIGGPEEILNKEGLGVILSKRGIFELSSELNNIQKKIIDSRKRIRAMDFSCSDIGKVYKQIFKNIYSNN